MILAKTDPLTGLRVVPTETMPGDSAERAAKIRDFIASAPLERFTILPGQDPRRAVAGLVSFLAYVRATDQQALAVAVDTAAQLAGSEVDVEHVISGVRITVSAEEPIDEMTDATYLSFDGSCVAKLSTRRGAPVDIDAHWESMHGYASRPPFDPNAPRPSMI